MLKFVYRIAFVALVFLALAPVALADAPVHTSPVLVLPSKQLWTLMIGALVPLVTYVLNHVGPWVSEPTKAFVLVLVAAIAGGLYTALATSNFGWNSATIQMVLTAVIAALGAHQWLWKPSEISARLGGGSNAQGGGGHLVWQRRDPAPPAAPPAAE